MSDPIPIPPHVLKPCSCGKLTEAFADGSSYCPHCGRWVEAQAAYGPPLDVRLQGPPRVTGERSFPPAEE